MAANGFYEEVIIAGFGGQGILLAGKLLTQAAMNADFKVAYMPSYGAEVRGGTANSMIVVSYKPVASPLVTNPNSLVAMNKASMNKFSPRVKKNGLIVYNSSLIDAAPSVDGSIELLAIPADDLAIELKNVKVANMVMLGAYLQKKGYLSCDAAAKSLSAVLAGRYQSTIPLNTKALQRGAEFAKKS